MSVAPKLREVFVEALDLDGGVDEATIEALGPWLKGKEGLPDATLPGDLSTLVKAWDARPREEH